MNEKKIIRRCQKQDLNAYKMIYKRYGQPLIRTANRILGDQQDAEDAVQMTFLKLYRGIQNFNFTSQFSTYLFRIMMNVCFDILRSRYRKIKIQSVALHSTKDPNLDFKLDLEKAISSLPERMRACFVLYAVEGVDQKDIATIMNLSLGGVKSSIFHAKVRLRNILSKNDIGAKA